MIDLSECKNTLFQANKQAILTLFQANTPIQQHFSKRMKQSQENATRNPVAFPFFK